MPRIIRAYTSRIPFQVSRKLTLTAGLRWDLPFAYTERYDRIGVFDPGATNPLAQATGLPLNGAVVYVNSSADPYRSVYNPHYKLFGPRLGLAYRFMPSTVVRLGYAIAYAPNDTNEPDTNSVNSATTTFVASLNGGITPYNTPADPYPTGLIPAAGRDAAKLSGDNPGADHHASLVHIRYPYVQQWNVTIGRDLGHGMVAEASYVGLKGTHLAIAGSANLNQLPDQYDSMGQALLTQVPNPFFGKIAIGPLANATVNAGQLLRPYPQYQNVLIPSWNVGNSTYHSLQTRFEKRFGNLGGTLMVNYTWSKLLSNVGTAVSHRHLRRPNRHEWHPGLEQHRVRQGAGSEQRGAAPGHQLRLRSSDRKGTGIIGPHPRFGQGLVSGWA